MKKILLACSAGLSTSMLVQRMQESAKELGIEVHIEAKATMVALDDVDNVDAILLGPQVRFELSKFQNKTNGKIPVEVINIKDYGTMNGKKVLSEIWDKIK